MGRKKKKNPNRSDASPPASSVSAHSSSPSRAVGSSAAASTAENSPVDVLSLRLVGNPSADSDRLERKGPSVSLTEQDAYRLDVYTGERVILLAEADREVDGKDENSSNVNGVSVCVVAINDPKSKGSKNSPYKKVIGQQSTLSPGYLRVSSSSVVDTLFPQKDSRIPESAIESVPITPTTVSLTQQQTPTSTPSKPFSFKIGGGGDRMYTPRTPDSTISNKSAVSNYAAIPKNGRTVWTVPVDSSFGQTLMKSLASPATTLKLRFADPKSTWFDLRSVGQVLKRIALAYFEGRYLQRGENLRISFQGKPLDFVVDDVDGITNNDTSLNRALENLRIEEDDLESRADSHALTKTMLQRDVSECLLRLFRVTYETSIEIETAELRESSAVDSSVRQKVSYVAGLEVTMEQMLSFLRIPLLNCKNDGDRKVHLPRGLLLHGPHGVGKSCLARQLAADIETDFDCEVVLVNCVFLQSLTSTVGQAERELSRYFQPPAKGSTAKLLIFDDIHLICPKRGGFSPGTDRLAATLLSLMDGVNSYTNNIVIIAITTDPSLLDTALRRPGRLDTEVEVPIPDTAEVRAKILRFHIETLGAQPPDLSEEDWIGVAKLAKGFTGADCVLAVKEGIRKSTALGENEVFAREAILTADALRQAIRETKPSSIKAVTVEVPQVLWSSIGGMDTVKRALRDAIELPLAHGEAFGALKLPPPRGILLYGPPGCSKTLMARALATEGHMNFLAVKGPELLSKWLGESERALASLFRRARLASPSIIFFDEVDAIATKRGSGDSATSSRLLSQLLTELDGVSNSGAAALDKSNKAKQQRVVVVCATNRPDLLDGALTRPGRIDRMIYVGLPDAESREQIFRISLNNRCCGEDIDFEELSRDEVSGGFSGAEIVALCRDAAFIALEEEQDFKSQTSCIKMRHLFSAVNGLQRQITPEMLAFYDSFRAKTSTGLR